MVICSPRLYHRDFLWCFLSHLKISLICWVFWAISLPDAAFAEEPQELMSMTKRQLHLAEVSGYGLWTLPSTGANSH